MKWYELSEKERIKKVYSKFTIKDFWDFWSDGQPLWMEERTVDYSFAKEMGQKLNVYYSHTGVFVRDAIQLKRVIAYARENDQMIWFGVQPRKWGHNKYGNHAISGGDNFVSSINFIFIDIDRRVKSHPAVSEELKECDIVANEILSRFAINNWNKSYVKICSGNGVQLLIKLDYAIKVPEVKYKKLDDEYYAYIANAEFDKTKFLVADTVGKSMRKYIYRFMKDNNIKNVEIDKAGFRMAQVAALPVTKNYKFGGFTWRGVVELSNEPNDGLSDYLLYMGENIVERSSRNIFGYTKKRIDPKKRLRAGKFKENSLVQLMLNSNLPRGERNNYLFFQLKCLIRDCKIDMNSKEFRILHKELEKAYGGNLTLNLPEKRFSFNESIVNKFCINNRVPPIYELYEYKKLEFDGGRKFKKILEELSLESGEHAMKEFVMTEEIDIDKDMDKCQKEMIEGNGPFNAGKLNSFVKACREKYDDRATKYFIKYLFLSFFMTKM